MGDGVFVIFDFKNCFFCRLDAIVDDCIYGNRNVVAGYRFLVGHVDGFNAHINFFIALKNTDDKTPAGIHYPREFSHSEFNASFVLVYLFYAGEKENNNENTYFVKKNVHEVIMFDLDDEVNICPYIQCELSFLEISGIIWLCLCL